MGTHYNFSKMKARKNPYVKLLKHPVTIRIDRDTVAYFKAMGEDGTPISTTDQPVSPGLCPAPEGAFAAVGILD